MEERRQLAKARRALARMQDIPTGWKDSNMYHRISIPPDVQNILRYLGPLGDPDGRFTCAFNRLDDINNVGVLDP